MKNNKTNNTTNNKNIIYFSLLIITTVIAFFIIRYIKPFPINFTSSGFWFGITFAVIIGCSISGVYATMKYMEGKPIISVLIGCVFVILQLIFTFFSSEMFNASIYANLITVETANFDEDIPTPSDLNKIPLMDSATAARLGSRAIGELTDVVSQYQLSSYEYSTIIYNGEVVKVAPLEYAGFFKWMNNKGKGIPGYIMVHPETNEAEFIELEKPIYYSPSAYFGKNIVRYAYNKHPDLILKNCMFQIDDNGDPYWSCMIAENKAFLGAYSPAGVLLINASTGETAIYNMDEIPEWVDLVITGDNVFYYYNNYGAYQNGWLNAMFAQNGCTKATNDFGFLEVNGNICIYTGITSVNNDSSNLGFIIVNSRTGEFKYYSSAGADEASAMGAAEGAVQNYGYKASFPSLINVNGEPVYALALKDDNGLVKSYAFVNEQNYTIVGIGDTLGDAMTNYKEELTKNGYDIANIPITDNIISKEEIIKEIYYIPINNETITYIKTESGNVYKENFKESHILLNVGDNITVNYDESQKLKILSATF